MSELKVPFNRYFRGEKISLKPFEKEDISLVASWNNNEDINSTMLSRFPVSIYEQEKWYEKTINDRSKKKLIIEINESGEKAGMASLFNIDSKNLSAEVGVYLDPAYHGKGYAKEAIIMLSRFAFHELNMHKLYASVIEFNEASVKVFESAGFSKEYIKKEAVFTNGKFYDVQYLCLFKRDFRI
ncbi:MAG: GNAT family N-acetyltransferase [Ignavibacteria bacterium]|nr:GNAT family N-acetyltransferase [Ignavibacteria bacterium]